jgi:hypothetical protein
VCRRAGREAEVVQPAVVPEGDAAAGVDLVVPDPVVGGNHRASGDGLRAGRIGLGGSAAAQRPVRTDSVVVADESVQLVSPHGHAGRLGLRGVMRRPRAFAKRWLTQQVSPTATSRAIPAPPSRRRRRSVPG